MDNGNIIDNQSGEPNSSATPTNATPGADNPTTIDDATQQSPEVLITSQADKGTNSPDSTANAQEPEATIEINEETIRAYAEDIGLADIPEFNIGEDLYGDQQTMSRKDMQTLVPAMMKLGIPKEKATETMCMVAAYQKLQLERATQEAREAINQRIAESKAKFGDDLSRICADAEKGAMAIFDKGLWQEMCETPILINDARFIDALARVGRMIKTDTGTKASSTGDASSGPWSAQHWIESSAKFGK